MLYQDNQPAPTSTPELRALGFFRVAASELVLQGLSTAMIPWEVPPGMPLSGANAPAGRGRQPQWVPVEKTAPGLRLEGFFQNQRYCRTFSRHQKGPLFPFDK